MITETVSICSVPDQAAPRDGLPMWVDLFDFKAAGSRLYRFLIVALGVASMDEGGGGLLLTSARFLVTNNVDDLGWFPLVHDCEHVQRGLEVARLELLTGQIRWVAIGNISFVEDEAA